MFLILELENCILVRKRLESNHPLTVSFTRKAIIMRKVKLNFHKTYQDKRKSEDVFAVMFP
mgnify:FL=1